MRDDGAPSHLAVQHRRKRCGSTGGQPLQTLSMLEQRPNSSEISAGWPATLFRLPYSDSLLPCILLSFFKRQSPLDALVPGALFGYIEDQLFTVLGQAANECNPFAAAALANNLDR